MCVCVCLILRYFIYHTMVGGLVYVCVCNSEILHIPHNGRWTSISVCMCVNFEVLPVNSRIIHTKDHSKSISLAWGYQS